MAQMLDYRNYDAIGLKQLIDNYETTPYELLQAALSVAKDNEHINSICMYHEKIAIDAAKHDMPDSEKDAPFYGIPFLLKNLKLNLKGTTTDNCCVAYKNNAPATEDSWLVKKYKKLGFNIFGKTNSAELGLAAITKNDLYGETKNPLNPEYSCGGSSGGAAAAVSAGIVPIAHGTDGLGSLRTPASLCGVFALKPTRNSITDGTHAPEGWGGLTTWNVISRTVRDSHMVFANTANYMKPDNKTKLKIAYNVRPPAGHAPDPKTVEAMEDTVALLRLLGHECEELQFKYDYKELSKHISTVVASHTASNNYDVDYWQLGHYAKYVARRGKEFTAADYIKAVEYMTKLSNQMQSFLAEYDIYLNPTTGELPWKLEDISLTTDNTAEIWSDTILRKTPFTPLANVTGQPSMTVPLFWTKENLPIGMLFNGRWGEESLLFNLAYQLEKEKPWIGRYNYE